MTTGSTKSNRKKQSQKTAQPVLAEAVVAADLSDRTWLISAIVIMAIGAFLRLYNLALVPFHHDEGVNGNFLVHLVRDNVYRYDPQNYHGPTLYYFSAIIPGVIRFLFGPSAQNTYGLTTFNVRLVTALFGLGTIWLVLLLRSRLGSVGTLSAAALLAVSPGAVYLSRYFIHESLFVFFTLGIVVAAVKYYDDGHPVYLVLAAASAGLLFATKETWIISAGVLLIALAATYVYRRLWRIAGMEYAPETAPTDSAPTTALERIGGIDNIFIWGPVALAICMGISILFYSSFFKNWQGVSDSLRTFQIWSQTGSTAHVHPWRQYLDWLKEEEAPLLLLGAMGALLAVIKPKNSLALFCGLWAFGILAAYSMVPYKTPWLSLNFILPLSLASGYAFQWLYEYTNRQLSRPLLLLAALALGIGTYQMIVLNFFKYDDDTYIYVYAHTRRETLALLDDIDKVAKHAQGFDTGITIMSPDYWPLPWYFRDYKRVGYYAQMSATNEPIIIASEPQRDDVLAKFGDRYRQVDTKFPLRPGVDLLLFVRKDVAGP